ncbi:MAG: SAM-dependent methyltransferase [Pseudomonadota bacterium]|nr:SAM-dependent methyltransferase [Pseudomonadota bacterium]
MNGVLRDRLARLIAVTGPISVMQYMGEATAHYYSTRDPLGAAGDFITAPEISQMFGELIGIWLADIWIRAGRPAPVHYVEAGPGRGTLARDALAAAARFGLEPTVHLVETSPTLRAVQRILLPQARWHDDLATLPEDGPLLVVANEFLDALPVRQLVMTQGGWRERMVAHRDGRFMAIAGDRPMDAAVPAERRDAAPGMIIETCPGAATAVQSVAQRLAAQGGAALFIDYGYTVPATGSSLQAVHAHARVDPFTDPGGADLTALVDFAALAEVAQAAGARWLGTVEQGAFLQALGIAERANALTRAVPDHAAAVAAALARLTDVDQMGTLFKLLGLAAPDWPDGAGF